MEQHGKNPRQNIIAIIPARLKSTRLENKLLLPLAGKPLILHTAERTKSAEKILRVIVATDSEEILQVVLESGNEAVLTSEKHQSGSDRIAEVAESLPQNSIIVNVQGDEPLIPKSIIEKAIEAILQDQSADIVTTSEKFSSAADILNPNNVKIVCDKNSYALYFSRSPVPFPREAANKFGTLENALREDKNLLSLFRKHTGLYVYRREFLLKFTKMPQTILEKTELLEQLRALENGARIKVVEAAESSIGVDTREDFERVREILERQSVVYREAKAEDIPQIARVHVESWQKSFVGIVPQGYLDNMSVEKRTEKWTEVFRRGSEQNTFYKLFVAETPENGIVGFADFGAPGEDSNKFDAELYAIYFSREFQRKGIGGNLFKLCRHEIASSGRNSMCLHALEASPYRTFYEKMGGRVVGEGAYNIAGIDFKTLTYGWDDLQKYV